MAVINLSFVPVAHGISPKYIVMSENQRDCQGQAYIEAIAQAE